MRVLKGIVGSIGLLLVLGAVVVAAFGNRQMAFIRRLDNVDKWQETLAIRLKENHAPSRRELLQAGLYYGLVTEAFPKIATAYAAAGYCYAQAGDVTQARKYLRKGLNLYPTNIWLEYNVAVLEFASGRKASALGHFRHITQANLQTVMNSIVLASLSKFPASERMVLLSEAKEFAIRLRTSAWKFIINEEHDRATLVSACEQALNDELVFDKTHFLKVIFSKDLPRDQTSLDARDVVIHPWAKWMPFGKEMMFN